MIDVSIVTVGMNHLKYLKALLPSLYGSCKPRVSFEMIYVDNCSTDGSVDFVRDYCPDAKIIINNEPLGFGENNNRGVFASTGKYIAIINPDIVLQPVDWAIGAAFFMSRMLHAELSGFDQDYFIYREDEDLCLEVA